MCIWLTKVYYYVLSLLDIYIKIVNGNCFNSYTNLFYGKKKLHKYMFLLMQNESAMMINHSNLPSNIQYVILNNIFFKCFELRLLLLL